MMHALVTRDDQGRRLEPQDFHCAFCDWIWGKPYGYGLKTAWFRHIEPDLANIPSDTPRGKTR